MIADTITVASIDAALKRSLGSERAETLVRLFKPKLEEACAAVAETSKINVTDATQVTEIKAARAARLRLKAIRVETDKIRKAEKQSAQMEATAIQDIYNGIEALIAPEEERLEACEKFAERAEAQRKHAIKLRRQSDLAYQNFVTPTGIILEDLDDAEWDNLLTRAKSEKAENDRKSREAWEHREKEREAAERLAEENRKLRAEQARKDAEAKEAREAAEREAASASTP